MGTMVCSVPQKHSKRKQCTRIGHIARTQTTHGSRASRSSRAPERTSTELSSARKPGLPCDDTSASTKMFCRLVWQIRHCLAQPRPPHKPKRVPVGSCIAATPSTPSSKPMPCTTVSTCKVLPSQQISRTPPLNQKESSAARFYVGTCSCTPSAGGDHHPHQGKHQHDEHNHHLVCCDAVVVTGTIRVVEGPFRCMLHCEVLVCVCVLMRVSHTQNTLMCVLSSEKTHVA